MFRYLFGPVPSRRLGMSLGIDLIPHKICTLNCVYCEVGRTTNLTLERKEYVPYDEVIKEVDKFFSTNVVVDYITFSGSGEPTLNSRIGDVIDYIKSNYQNIPVAVLTNGSLLYDWRVRKELNNADVILPSLDAVSNDVFLKIDRPHSNLDINEYIKGLIDFRKEFKGKIWLEVFILPKYNLIESELLKLKEVILKIKPDLVQLNTLDRPGTVTDLQAATYEQMKSVVDFWGMPNVVIISSVTTRKQINSYSSDVENIILQTIARRPCTLDDLIKITGFHTNEINKYLDVLEKDNKIKTVKLKRGFFYQIR